MEQKIIRDCSGMDEWLIGKNRVFLVCDASLSFLPVRHFFDERADRFVRFDSFRPNPLYESVVKGVEVFRSSGCDSILAVGGGSAMDVAKCIKLFSGMEGDGSDGSFLRQQPGSGFVPFLAVPTTAGTGSEATRYAVIYYGGAKQSVTDDRMIPETVLLDAGLLRTLPDYQRKATMCDALCHAIESFWSVNSTEESRAYSGEAIRGILENMDGYLDNTDRGNAGMLTAAHLAGKAINIAQTTAGHAMCYKITSLFGTAHGHAAMLCDRVLFRWMVGHTDACVDPRGEEYLKSTLDRIGRAMGCADARSGAEKLAGLFERLELEVPEASEDQYRELAAGVNPVRLKNHPVALKEETIDDLYHQILR